MKRILFVMMAVVCGVCAYSQSKVVAHRGYWKTEGSAQNSIRALV
ncbi:MAG: glycerophosphodiester phosphodiesterase, partial [Bacteroidales bacterium]|nr:glycerophosphodiester phosphodiesterase [Bacteroidales bacterium]